MTYSILIGCGTSPAFPAAPNFVVTSSNATKIFARRLACSHCYSPRVHTSAEHRAGSLTSNISNFKPGSDNHHSIQTITRPVRPKSWHHSNSQPILGYIHASTRQGLYEPSNLRHYTYLAIHPCSLCLVPLVGIADCQERTHYLVDTSTWQAKN